MAGLGKGVAFVAVLAMFGLGFWLLSGDNLRTAKDFVLGASSPAPAPAPVVQVTPAAPTVIVITGPGGTLRLQPGSSDTLDLGHREHQLRVQADHQGEQVVLDTGGGRHYTGPAGGTLVVECEAKQMERSMSDAGVLSMRQVACPDHVTLSVRLE